MDVLTSAASVYMTTFSGYVNQFIQWGKYIFYALLVLNIIWMSLWYAFDKNSLSESMPSFLKQFFIAALFYTIMVNPSWLLSLLKTAESMGKTITGIPIDPSSIISNGLVIANKILIPIQKSSLLTAGFGVLVGFAAWVVIMFTFISIALNLAITLIITTALIVISALFLSFAALGATGQIARQALDVVIGNCVKLLGIYLVVGVGAKTITTITNAIPNDFVSLDPYAWIIAASLLFWLVAKNLPEQLAKIVSNAIQETRGADAAALTMAASRIASMAAPGVGKVAGAAVSAAANLGKIAGSTTANAMAHFNKASSTPGSSAIGSMGTAIGGAAKDLGSAIGGRLSDQFKHIASKMTGGPGIKQTTASGHSKPLASVAERMYAAGQDVKSSYSALPKQGQPSSAGRKAAAPSSTRGQSTTAGGVSKPKKDT